jgi:hypothetical protein
VGDFEDPKVKASWGQFEKKLSGLQIGGFPVKVHKMDAEENQASDVAKITAERDDTVFVVGHFSSTASKSALFHYFSANPPIPVILPVESNPDLIARDISQRSLPVFQIVPTDDEQAKKAAAFADEIGTQRVWVIEDDASNPTYTHYLATEFIKQVQNMYNEKGYLNDCELSRETCSHIKAKGKNLKPDRYHAHVVLWSTIRNMPSRSDVDALNADFVFLVAAENDCLLVLNELNMLWRPEKKPTLLAAKGCEKDLTIGANVLLPDAFMTHYIPAKMFNSEHYYSVPGIEASELIEAIFKDAQESQDRNFFQEVRSVFNVRSGKDIRLALAKVMERREKFNVAMADASVDDAGENFSFRKDGQVDGKSFRVWKLEKEGRKFSDLGK